MPKSYFNFPSKIDKEAYLLACSCILETFSRFSDVKSIFQYGSILNPGLSDLDIAIVLNDELSASTAQSVHKSKLPKSVLDIMDYATLMVFPRIKFERLAIWDDVDLTQIYGPTISIDDISNPLVDIPRVVDWLPERIVRVEELCRSDKVNVRKTLGTLKSCTYSLKKLNHLVAYSNDRSSLIDDFQAFRCSWFTLSEDKQIYQLCYFIEKVRRELYVGLKEFGEWCIDSKWFLSVSDQSRGYLSFADKFSYRFCNLLPGQEYVRLGKNHVIELSLPSFYFLHFLEYASADGIISNEIKKSMVTSGDFDHLPLDMRLILGERIDLVNLWGNWLLLNGFEGGIFKFGWFFDSAKKLVPPS